MNFYEVLGVDHTATLDDIRCAYKRLALQYHPDKTTGDRDIFERVHVAYTALKDPNTRKRIDDLLIKSHDDAMEELVSVFMDILYQQFRKTKKCVLPSERKSDLILNVDVHLRDIYQGCLKKIVTKVKRGGEWTRHTCVLNLFEFKHCYIFERQGDDNQGDIVVRINVVSPNGYEMIGNDLHMSYDVDLHTYLYGGTATIRVLDTETIKVPITPRQKIICIDDYGFPYVAKEDSRDVVRYGSLVLNIDVRVDENVLQKEEVEYFIHSHFKIDNKDAVVEASE